jgi:alpha-glucoside transport system substrate-binding protein
VGGVEQEAFQKMLDAFKAKAGITATYESQRTDYATVLRTRISGGNAPDVAIMPGIGFLRSFVADGQIKPLNDLGMDRAATEAAFAPGSLAPAVINNELYAVMMKLSSKSVVWCKPNSSRSRASRPRRPTRTWSRSPTPTGPRARSHGRSAPRTAGP